MMIGEISFCDQVGFNIKTDETKRFILEMIQNKYGLKIITKHFEKYEDRMFDNIQKRPHLLCLRSNGNPYFLCLIKLNFVNYCIFIDKKIQQGYSYPRMIICHFRFADELFKDTIFDGEMVKMNDGSWAYLMNDIMVLKGVHLREHNLVKRINYLYDVIATNFHPDIHDICRFGVKQYFKYDEAMTILEKHINEVQYSCRGIYFKPLFLKFKDVLINFNDELITKVERTSYKHIKSFVLKEDRDKLCHTETASISSESHGKLDRTTGVNREYFNTRKTNLPDVYEIYNNDMSLIGYPAVPSMQISNRLRETFRNKNIVDTVQLQYSFCDKLNKWILVC